MARTLLLLLALGSVSLAPGQDVRAARPKVALALAGGGAYGLMDLGALEWLERHRIPVDAIAGTSGGALVGGWYATGIEMLSDEEIAHPVEPRRKEDLRLRDAAPALEEIDYERLFDSGPDYRNLSLPQKRERRLYPNDLFAGLQNARGLRRDGLVPGQAVGFLLDRIGLDYGNGFEGLPTPFRAVAVDATASDPARWRTVVLGGPRPEIALGLSRAIRASIAVPFLFAPVVADGRRLIDGAVRDNLPTDVAIDAFAPDVLIALRWDNGDGPDPYRPGAGGRSPKARTVVTFDPRPYRVDGFRSWRALAWIGYQGMEARRAELERYALPLERFLAYRKGRRARPASHRVRGVEGDVEGLGGIRRAVVGCDLDAPEAMRALAGALDRLTADQGLATAGYSLRPDGVLVVRTTRHRGGPAFVRAGLDVEVNSGDRPWANVRARVSDLRPDRPAYRVDLVAGTTTALSGGLELPVGKGVTVGPTFRLERAPQFRFRGDQRRSEATIGTAEAGLGLFYRPSRALEFALEGFAGANGADARNGVAFDPQSGAYRGFLLRAESDTTDDAVVPRRGARAWLMGRSFDGAFTQAEGRLDAYRRAFGVHAGFGTGFGGDAPFPFEFRPRVAPYRRDEIRDDAYLSLGFSATRPIAPLPFALGRAFLVCRVENAWASGRTYPGATLTLLADTRAGAASLGLGVASHGAVRLLLGLGRRF